MSNKNKNGVADTSKTKITGTVATDIKPQKTQRYLRYDFNDDEKRRIGSDLARELNEKKQIENEKKAANSQFKFKLDGKQASIDTLSQNLSNGYEHRSTNCEIRFNDPVIGKKSTYRLDLVDTSGNPSLVDTENMTESELQLKIDLDHENSAVLAEEENF